MKVYIKNQQKLIRINRQKIVCLLRKALRLLGIRKAELSILLVNDRRMRMLNLQYRGLDKTTDVLSFPQNENSSSSPFTKDGQGGITNSECLQSTLILGDIVINLHKAQKQAEENGITFNEEMKRLLIHGLLHLVGYDHEKNRYAKRKMQKKAEELFELSS
jgi:probable rRNA maturation factor